MTFSLERLGVPAFPEALRAHWEGSQAWDGDALRAARAAITEIIGRDCSPPSAKGYPNVNLVRRDLALRLKSLLGASGPDESPEVSSEMLAVARSLAASDLLDPQGFSAYLFLMVAASLPALSMAARHLKRNVVMHVTCVARIDRARESVASFGRELDEQMSQLIVIGSEDQAGFHFDATTSVLTVPAPDSYEHLPAKVVSALAFLALACAPQCVLKVDDDHRLTDAARLNARFRAARPSWLHAALYGLLRSESMLARRALSLLIRSIPRCVFDSLDRVLPAPRNVPVQMGILVDSDFGMVHARIWHFGKCRDARIDSTPLTRLGGRYWISGADGYVLNRAALLVALWGHVYYKDHVDNGLYEDRVISELIEKHGGLLMPAKMNDVLSTTEKY